MKTVEYLDAIRAKLQLPSDYALQVPLGVKRQSVSNYRRGRSSFEPAVALRVAAILELDPMKVLADVELERAGSPELEAFWKSIARKVAAVAVAAIAVSGGAPDAQARFDNNPNCTPSEYTLRNKRRWPWTLGLVTL